MNLSGLVDNGSQSMHLLSGFSHNEITSTLLLADFGDVLFLLLAGHLVCT
jgi:hypothetical protein